MNYLRFQAVEPSPSGRFPGVFALVNGLGASGHLSEAEAQWWRTNNAWFESHLTDPATVDPTVFERSTHPHTSSWFKQGATRFVQRTSGYLDILDAHDIEWTALRSDDPGPILYCDDHQVVVAGIFDPR